MVPTIFDLCIPRADVLAGTSSDADFAADLAHVLRGHGGPAEYRDATKFFANTYPTRGLRSLLQNVCGRLSGGGASVAAIFRLDTSFGGGKTHGLIALVHAARGMPGVVDPAEFVAPALIPQEAVRIAAFDGENADPANGRRMGDGVLAYTPWGEIAYALAGKEGYERVRRSDEQGVAPGAETIAELFGGGPALILLDELGVYLSKVWNRAGARDQLTAFLTSLFKAVESSPRAALVYTLALGKGGGTGDAYSAENQFVADKMAEAESVSARKATLLNPTEDDETIEVLRRRLFGKIDKVRAAEVVKAYSALWSHNQTALAPEAAKTTTLEQFVGSYPLHPDVLETFTAKTATLANFQRVRGMLRILGRTVARLWQERPADATAIHLHHVDPGYEPIRQEIVTRLGQSMYVSAIRSDIAGEGTTAALAQEIDAQNHKGLPLYATYVARTIFMHTLAFNEGLKGLTPEHLRYSLIGPGVDISFVEEARKAFVSQSAYLDDRPAAPLRFLAEANLTQIIRSEERRVDPGELRAQLNDRIKAIFSGPTLEAVPFPAGPWDVPDEVGSGRPLLAVLSSDACAVGAIVDAIPDLIARIYERKGSDGGSLRALRNNLVFIAAEGARVEEMRQTMARRLALREIKNGPRLKDLAEHQQIKVRELEAKSETEVAITIQQTFRHLFYPSQSRLSGATVSLAHSALDIHSASEKPGSGQQQVVRALRDYGKLRLAEDEPDAPAYVRDRTPLRKGQITTAALRDEFRRDPNLPVLIGDDVFIRGIRKGIEQGEYVYRRDTLLYGPGDATAAIQIDEQAAVFTMAFAKDQGIWPRPKPKVEPLSIIDGEGGGQTGDGGSQEGGGFREVQKKVGPDTVDRDGPDDKGKISPVLAPPVQPLQAEGVLREALIRIWEQARARKVDRLATLTIRVFDATDGFRLLGIVGVVKSADGKQVSITGGYETFNGSRMEVDFAGTPQDAVPVKEFLDPQLRAAKEKTVQLRFDLTFSAGLPMEGDAAEKLTEQLTKFATGAAYVEATATVAVPVVMEAAE
ncbi:ATP-binding protein [Paracraurococcus lichenis]|uniref:DUF499 domain-containing protein n=1 Tax=Paracraurococcus lichenis TaxID=3064888 RepID=A0ABT9EBC6_9PROT|nr:DUF499 domain-containing protein [Paracraurococcus sp. LOR1-02]MDO9713493.1 DUF499 domain-containing protein [Paracraurococcus sp. LOR1-02]